MSCGDRQALLMVPTATEPPTDVVRDWVESVLRSVPDLVRLRATLVAAELLRDTRHRGPGPYLLHVSLHSARRVLTIAVEDDAPDLGAGWYVRAGLVLSIALSENWGVDYGERGKTVWAELCLFTAGEDTSERISPIVREEP